MRRTAALLLLLLALAATVALAGCGGGEEAAPTAETVVGTLPESESTESTDTETGAAETDGETETGDGGAGGEGDPAAGKEIFTANCGPCHTLADAGTSGQVGPNLDDAQPDLDLVVERVTNGQGAMPSFKSQLDEQQINDVAAYVSSVAGS